MSKRKRVVVGVAYSTLPSLPSRSTPRRSRPHPRPQAPPQSASSHLGVNDIPAPLHPSCAPPPPSYLIPPRPPPLAPIATQSGAIPVRPSAYLHGCSMQLPMSTQVPNTFEASPTPSEDLHAFQFGILPPVQTLSCLIVAFLLVNRVRFKMVRQCCLLCRKLI